MSWSIKSAVGRATLGAVASLAIVGLALLGCSAERESTAPELGSNRAEIVALTPPTKVEAGSPTPRNATCPGRRLPDQCGSWAGVELEVSRDKPVAWHHHGGDSDAHCLCQPIDFQIPEEIPVASGRSGWEWDKLELSFRISSGQTVECRYKGNANPLGGHFGIPVGGDKYRLESCNKGFKGGQSTRSDWFELEIGHGHPVITPVAVQLRLGEDDVVGGVVQEQVFYASDPRIPGAALHVPRGSAPPFETFSLEVVPQVLLGSSLPNAGNPASNVSYVVDVRSDSSDSFTFTPLPGAACPRIDLPYDRATLDRLLGPGGEDAIRAWQLTSLSGISRGEQVLASVGPVTINLAQRTLSFCVEHLSYYLGGVGNFDSDLTGASIRSIGDPLNQLPATALMTNNALPKLIPGNQYELTLTFANVSPVAGGDWDSQLNLVPANIIAGAGSIRSTSTWGLLAPTWVYSAGTTTPPPGVPASLSNSTFTPSSGVPHRTGGTLHTATFVFNVTAPPTGTPLNFCLRSTGNAAVPFGDCFTWDPGNATTPGTGNVPLALTKACYDGTDATRNKGECKDGTQTFSGGTWSACEGQRLPADREDCNTKDDNCNGEVDEGVKNVCGVCAPEPVEVCDGLDNDCDGSVDEDVQASCGGCSEPPHPKDETCDNGQLGACYRSGQYVCTGIGSSACNVGPVAGSAEGCNGIDDDCNGTTDDIVECHSVFLHAGNVDDEVYVDHGYAADPDPLVGHFTLPPLCHAAAHGGGLAGPFVPGSVDCLLRDPRVVDGAGRAIFTISIVNSGCLDTSGDFSVEVDGNFFEMPGQGRVVAHCGVTHQFTIAVNLSNGSAPELLSSSSCINDGNCIR